MLSKVASATHPASHNPSLREGGQSTSESGRTPWGTLLAAGCFAGLGYAMDLGSGPPLLLAAMVAVALRTRRVVPVAVLLLGALPWVVMNHAITFAVGRVWVPLGMVPEYLDWPGSPFDPSNMTGLARHSPESFAHYAYQLLLGSRGFLMFNLPLLLAVSFGWLVFVRSGTDRIELAALVGWCVGVWIIYTLLSDNLGGGSLSVRWFVPLVVPGFWFLARLLAERRSFRADFVILACGGLVLAYPMWELGPWLSSPIPHHFEVMRIAVLAWAAVRMLFVVRWIVRKRGE
ncbi:MAG: hypothetical protein L0241_16330 [Planctomycetia bacterium]|nr:hypothetical protein [Planctomycetia bacterium]